ncbi:mRNA decay activator protein ZFP36L1-like [Macrobrachium nipponense]|uniref:mRNA decay activator protein ZFP36L1-like n=1 Tax=Macrobrachium nipponense TaxID=159736 RepID=UPI0030C88F7D
MDSRNYPRQSSFRYSTNPSHGFSRNQRTPPARRRLHFSSPPSSAGRGTGSGSYNRKDGAKQRTYSTVHLRYKTELCRAFEESGVCRFESDCTFAHGFEELRAVSRHPKYKTELCRTFHGYGFCLYGIRCHFVHSLDELGGLSPTDEYLIRKHQMEMLSNIARTETNTKPAINRVLLTNLQQLYDTQKRAGSPPLPQHLQQLLNKDLPTASSAAMLLMNQQQVPPDPAVAVADFLRQLNQMTVAESPCSKTETLSCDPDVSPDRLTEASLSGSMDTSFHKGLDSSGMSNSSVFDSPPKECLWGNEQKPNFQHEGNGGKRTLNSQHGSREERAAVLATAVAEAAIAISN